MDRELLSTYLNDHLGGSTTGTELAERLVEQNKDTRYHDPLERVCTEIKEDRATLQATTRLPRQKAARLAADERS